MENFFEHMKRIFFLFLLVANFLSSHAQTDGTIDTAYYYKKLTPAQVKASMEFLNDTAAYKYRQYKHYVKIVWPYVLEATHLMNDIDAKLASTASKAEKKKYIKAKEVEFKNRFEEPIKKLNINQGRILVKLINRQLGPNRTMYKALRQFKSAAAAAKWQLWAKANKMNLNEPYDKGKEIKLEGMLRRLGYTSVEYKYYD